MGGWVSQKQIRNPVQCNRVGGDDEPFKTSLVLDLFSASSPPTFKMIKTHQGLPWIYVKVDRKGNGLLHLFDVK